MSLINVKNLTFSYEGSFDNIFENVSFCIDTDYKLGFIGRNGRGKTTFLKLLLGEYQYSGKIESSVEFEYFPYRVNDEEFAIDLAYEKNPQLEYWQFARELNLLDIPEDVLYRPFKTLSPGERVKVMTAIMFTKENKFMLIDEPTNHLDSDGRSLLSKYLNSKKGFILVSHDRDLINGCADHILSINRTDIEVMRGNFSTWEENYERRREFELSKNEHLQKDIDRLQTAAKRTGLWSGKTEASKFGSGPVDRGFIGHKSAKMMKRAKSIEQRRSAAIKEKSSLLKNIERTDPLKLSPLSSPGTLLELKNVSIFIGNNKICGPVSFALKDGERLILSGKNGSGKSSILKLILGTEFDFTGTLYRKSGLKISYVPQDTSELNGNMSDYAANRGIDESKLKTILRKLGFERVQFEKDMSALSEGQKKKVLIAASLCESAHIYIWDEPMNYVDVISRMQIEELIKRYSPTMLLVEHDAAFRRAIGAEIAAL